MFFKKKEISKNYVTDEKSYPLADLFKRQIDIVRSDYALGKIDRVEYLETLEKINENCLRIVSKKVDAIEERLCA